MIKINKCQDFCNNSCFRV